MERLISMVHVSMETLTGTSQKAATAGIFPALVHLEASVEMESDPLGTKGAVTSSSEAAVVVVDQRQVALIAQDLLVGHSPVRSGSTNGTAPKMY
jgi:hypothetical protein